MSAFSPSTFNPALVQACEEPHVNTSEQPPQFALLIVQLSITVILTYKVHRVKKCDIYMITNEKDVFQLR